MKIRVLVKCPRKPFGMPLFQYLEARRLKMVRHFEKEVRQLFGCLCD